MFLLSDVASTSNSSSFAVLAVAPAAGVKTCCSSCRVGTDWEEGEPEVALRSHLQPRRMKGIGEACLDKCFT